MLVPHADGYPIDMKEKTPRFASLIFALLAVGLGLGIALAPHFGFGVFLVVGLVASILFLGLAVVQSAVVDDGYGPVGSGYDVLR